MTSERRETRSRKTWSDTLLRGRTDHRKNPVQTSVLRLIRARLQVTHDERGISVISGPWGIGKTTAVDLFARDNSRSCVVVKVEQGSTTSGASPVSILQQTLEALRPHIGRSPRAALSNAYWSLRQMVYNYLTEWSADNAAAPDQAQDPLLTIIFDEAQYLSRRAIEMLRYWNDEDRTVTPFPIGLCFVGNSEFALDESPGGESVISGAVRSRALFIESLDYQDLTNSDIVSFFASLGTYDAEAISRILDCFGRPRTRRDIRAMARMDGLFQARARDQAITLQTVQAVLG